MNKKEILVVEDEIELARLLRLHLEDAGYEVTLAQDGTRGLELATGRRFDCIVLDLMLPGVDGLDICQQVRRQSDTTPILMLTARSSEGDRVLGLEVGADDYLTKPFSVRELVARVKAILRRVEALSRLQVASDPLVVGDFEIDAGKRSLKLRSRPLNLTAREFDLLAHFASHPGRAYSRSELLDQVWGYGYHSYEHTVNSHINRLRANIEDDPARPRYILTGWGVGYKFFDPREAESEGATAA